MHSDTERLVMCVSFYSEIFATILLLEVSLNRWAHWTISNSWIWPTISSTAPSQRASATWRVCITCKLYSPCAASMATLPNKEALFSVTFCFQCGVSMGLSTVDLWRITVFLLQGFILQPALRKSSRGISTALQHYLVSGQTHVLFVQVHCGWLPPATWIGFFSRESCVFLSKFLNRSFHSMWCIFFHVSESLN